jgi:hypothetical protein
MPPETKIERIDVHLPGGAECRFPGEDVIAFAPLAVPDTAQTVIRVVTKNGEINDFYGCAVRVVSRQSAIVPGRIELPGGHS